MSSVRLLTYQRVIQEAFNTEGWEGVLPLLPMYSDLCEEEGSISEAKLARIPWRINGNSKWIITKAPWYKDRIKLTVTCPMLKFPLFGIHSNIAVGVDSGSEEVELYRWMSAEYYDNDKLDRPTFLKWVFGKEEVEDD